MIIIILLAIFATVLDYIRENFYGMKNEHTQNLLKILLAFSFWTNADQILSVKEQKPGFIKCLDCIRTFSISWVIAFHSTFFHYFSETSLTYSELGKTIWNEIILYALPSVDTFFLLSGIVVAYLFFKDRPDKSTIKNPLTWMQFYLHRYLRLTPPYMIFVGFFAVYGPYIQGPYEAWMWNSMSVQTNACKRNWWRNLLYINNFQSEQSDTCYGVSWYLTIDIQLYLVAPIVLISLYYSVVIGSVVILAGCAGSILTTYILYATFPEMTIDSYRNYPNPTFTNVIYQKPWIRCTPFFIGLLTGYIIAKYGKRPIRLNWAICIVFWILAFGVGIACLFSTYDFDRGSDWSSATKATTYNFSRIGWAIAVSWVIIANHFGWGGPINSFMSHPIWQPFGRLSYCAYIVHWMVLFYYYNLGGRPLQFYSVWQVYCYYAIPVFVMSYVLAFFWSCLFEVPALKLEKMLMDLLFPKKKLNNEKIEDIKF